MPDAALSTKLQHRRHNSAEYCIAWQDYHAPLAWERENKRQLKVFSVERHKKLRYLRLSKSVEKLPAFPVQCVKNDHQLKDVKNGKYRTLFFTIKHSLLEQSACGIPRLPVVWFSFFKVVRP
jgi:hypothetical protein